MVWHRETGVPDSDLIVLPGGFSYGDYLRSGAMAAHSPVMQDVVKKAKAGLAAKNDKFSEVLDVNERVLATVLDR